ncbi:hypothetical protein NQZ68_038106 [Dissostichus eleginoides]|nr:hypothetical protein NQZ68_038106 [Dissostichus eleginoides]
MNLLLFSLLLAPLRALSSRSVSSGTFDVTQSPDFSVKEGETVNITCCWTLEFEQFRVTWLKHDTHFGSFNLKNLSQGSPQKETSKCSNLTLINVTREDSGTYICKVIGEIPVLSSYEGNGTVITVVHNTKDNSAREHSGSPGEEVFIYVLRCLPLLGLIVTFFIINFRAKSQRHTSAAPGNELTSAQRRGENQEEE